MKNLLALFFIGFTFTIHGQTIDSDWFYRIGDEYSINSITNNDDFDIPAEGIDQIWDFSTAIVQATEVVEIVEPSTLKFSNFFPEATVALLRGPFEIEEYFKATEDSLYLIGVASVQHNMDFRTELPLGSIVAISPMNFGDSLSHNQFVEYFTNNSSTGQSSSREVTHFNGVGTVVLPDTTYQNCIMLTQCYYFDGQNLGAKVYSFYQDRYSNNIAKFTTFDNGFGGEFEKQIEIQTDYTPASTSTSTSNILPLDLSVRYLDNGYIIITAKEKIDLEMQIMTSNGQFIQLINTNIEIGENTISTKKLQNSGSYFILLIDKKTGRFSTKKISNIN